MRRVAFLHPYAENDPEVRARVRCISQRTRGARLDREPQYPNIYTPVELWAKSKLTRWSWCVRHQISLSAAARRSSSRQNRRLTPSRSYQRRQRSGRTRFRGDPVASRRQNHWLHFHRLSLVKEIAPWVTRGAVLWDPMNSSGIAQFGVIQAMAPSLGVEWRPVDVRDVLHRGSR
jgi:hypothetical protein